MSPLAPLMAVDLEQLIGIVIVILFIIVPAVLQLLGKGQQQKPAAGKRPPPRPVAAEIEDEIGEFLQQAAKRRGGREPPQPARPRPAERPVVAQVVPQQALEPEAPLGKQVQQHVGEYLDAGEFSRRASELGGEVARADQSVEQRLQQVFDHDLGRLAAVPGESAAAPRSREPIEMEDQLTELPGTAAAGLAAMFSNVRSIRQAIVINEVLQRPEHRW